MFSLFFFILFLFLKAKFPTVELGQILIAAYV